MFFSIMIALFNLHFANFIPSLLLPSVLFSPITLNEIGIKEMINIACNAPKNFILMFDMNVSELIDIIIE